MSTPIWIYHATEVVGKALGRAFPLPRGIRLLWGPLLPAPAPPAALAAQPSGSGAAALDPAAPSALLSARSATREMSGPLPPAPFGLSGALSASGALPVAAAISSPGPPHPQAVVVARSTSSGFLSGALQVGGGRPPGCWNACVQAWWWRRAARTTILRC